MADVISQLPPVTIPMVDKSGQMNPAWRRFFESQWLRSGGFQDYIYAAILAANFGDATLAELVARTEELQQQQATQAATSEAIATTAGEQTEQNQRAIDLLNARISAVTTDDLEQQLKNLERDIVNLRAQMEAVRGEDVAQQLSALTTTSVAEGTNLYFTQARVRTNVSATGSISYNSATGIFSYTAGTSAAYDIGTSGAKVPLLNGANTWAATQTFTLAPVFTDASGTRTALSLGTAALQNTGTTGANVPLLNGANAWTGAQSIGDGSTTAPSLIINGSAATAKRLSFQDAGVTRWDIGPNSSNTFAIRLFDASGTLIGTEVNWDDTTGVGTWGYEQFFTGGIGFGTYTATPSAVIGYLSVKDAAGNARKVAVIS